MSGPLRLTSRPLLRAQAARLARLGRRLAEHTAERQSKLAPALAAGAAVAAATAGTVLANDNQLHPPSQPWCAQITPLAAQSARPVIRHRSARRPARRDFTGFLSSYDAASVRRGHQVYTQVCASCHGLSRIAYRNLANVCYRCAPHPPACARAPGRPRRRAPQ